MSFLKSLMVGAAGMSLAAMPVAAHAADASKLSVTSQARAAKSTDGEQLAGGGVIVAVLAAAAVIAGIIIVADEDDNPDSQ